MRGSFDEGQVERAYSAIRDCLEGVEAHFRLIVRMFGGKHRSPMEAPTLRAEDLKTMAQVLSRLRSAYDAAHSLLPPLERELPALAKEAVQSGSIRASSWAEAVLFHAEVYLRDPKEWQRFGELKVQRQWELQDVVTGNMPNVPQFRASLKIEEARLRERALPAGGRYRALLLQLPGQSAGLMDLLVESEGEKVTHEDIASCLWPGEAVDGSRIHKAVSRLKRELVALSYPEVAGAILSRRGWYRFGGGEVEGD